MGEVGWGWGWGFEGWGWGQFDSKYMAIEFCWKINILLSPVNNTRGMEHCEICNRCILGFVKLVCCCSFKQTQFMVRQDVNTFSHALDFPFINRILRDTLHLACDWICNYCHSTSRLFIAACPCFCLA